jgi:hypothetical protein
MSVSRAGWGVSETTHTLKFEGFIQDHPVLILLYSGSSHSFLNEKFQSLLPNIQLVSTSMQVRVASGAVLRCQHKIQQLQWHLQGCAFHTDVTLLPLPCYDMILGMDWLQSFSPRRVHWAHKWLSIPYQGRTVTLHGQSATTGIAFFAECLRHSAKAILHSAKPLPSVTLGKEHSAKISSAKGSLPSVFFRTLGKDFAECQKTLGKEKHSAN